MSEAARAACGGDGVERFDSAEAWADACAALLVEALEVGLEKQGEAVLAVAGGRTPGPVFDRLARTPLDWSHVAVTLVDDRWVDEDHPDSNAGLVKRRLLTGKAEAATFVPLKRGRATPEEDAAEAARALDGLSPPIEAVLLGMGDDGHFASLFPGNPALEAGLRGDATVLAAPAGVDMPPPQPRLTLSLPPIAEARRVVLALSGQSKLDTLARVRAGDDAAELPVRAVLARAKDLRILWTPEIIR